MLVKLSAAFNRPECEGTPRRPDADKSISERQREKDADARELDRTESSRKHGRYGWRPFRKGGDTLGVRVSRLRTKVSRMIGGAAPTKSERRRVVVTRRNAVSISMDN